MGITDSAELDALANAIDNLANVFIDNSGAYRDAILSALENTRIYGELWGITYYADLYQFLEALSIDDQAFVAAKNEVMQNIDNAVIAKKNNEDGPESCGLNFYFPRAKIDYNNPLRYEDTLPAPYEETLFAQDNSWDEFLKAFLGLDDNSVPDVPAIDGTARGETGVEYGYTVSASDQDGDTLYYYIDWGDGNTSGWIGPYASGEEVTRTHTWTITNTYTIRAKSRDAIASESNWGTLEVSMPKTKGVASNATILLAGFITDLETWQEENFRFLPVRLLCIQWGREETGSMEILDELHGGYPCCGYINQNDFSGVITPVFICGLWQSS